MKTIFFLLLIQTLAASILVTEPTQAAPPVEIVNLFSAATKTGINLEEAQAICQKNKELYSRKFYFVYCHFMHKNWSEIEKRSGHYTEYRLMGYETIHTRSHAGSSVVVSGNGIFTKTESHAGSSHYESRPIMGAVSIPYTYEETVSKSIFGIKIFGLGEMKSLPWKLLYSARDATTELVPAIRFETKQEALRTCLRILAFREESDLNYYKGRCSSVEESPGQFYFEIKTQNPLVVEE